MRGFLAALGMTLQVRAYPLLNSQKVARWAQVEGFAVRLGMATTELRKKNQRSYTK
jgi:hypothetical protein